MGTYTGLRFRAIIKESFSAIPQQMEELTRDWHDIAKLYQEEPRFSTYAQRVRSAMIPHGALYYMPDAWENPLPDPKTNRFAKPFTYHFDPETCVWQFQCSLKKVERTIEAFFELIVPVICEHVYHLETYYEYADTSVLYELQDQQVKRSERQGICYAPHAAYSNNSSR